VVESYLIQGRDLQVCLVLSGDKLKIEITKDKKGNQQIEHNFQDDDICNICKIPLSAENGAIVTIVADEYDESRVYCTYCSRSIIHTINKLQAEPWGIRLCSNCAVPNKECRCNKKKIDYNLRKKLK
tara:strand:+ start:85 stop:465 length:381 start_codon:yes stop_codon:yes gene_type:complete